MTEIQGGRWDGVLRKLFPVKGTTVASQLAPEIVPTCQVQAFDPDMHWLRGEHLLWAGSGIGPVAGQFAQVNLRNDSTDRLVIVERIAVFANTAATIYRVTVGNNAVGNAVSVFGRDTRRGLTITAGSVAGVVRSNTLVAALSGDAMLIAAPAILTTIFIEGPIVLPPDAAVFLCDVIANQNMYCSFLWRERPFEPGEV